jgi:hypothetical protein
MSLVEDGRPSSKTSFSTCRKSRYNSRSDTRRSCPIAEGRRSPLLSSVCDVLEPRRTSRRSGSRAAVEVAEDLLAVDTVRVDNAVSQEDSASCAGSAPATRARSNGSDRSDGDTTTAMEPQPMTARRVAGRGGAGSERSYWYAMWVFAV